jgi:hypothetical protein
MTITRDVLTTLCLQGLFDRVWFLYTLARESFKVRYGRETSCVIGGCIYIAAKETKRLLSFSRLAVRLALLYD